MNIDSQDNLSESLQRALEQIVVNWDAYPQLEALKTLLAGALKEAKSAEVQVLTVTSPVSPARLRLKTLTELTSLDAFYGGESAELCLNHDGRCYLVYRRSDGGDYAVEWSSATLMPESLMRALPDVLAAAMFDGPNKRTLLLLFGYA